MKDEIILLCHMISYSVFHSFSVGNEGGNAAGIVMNAADYSADQMQAIAAKLGYVETVFIDYRAPHDIHLRYFTPLKELSMTGHPTLAAWSYLVHEGLVPKDSEDVFSLRAPGGMIKIRQKDGTVFLSQTPPTFQMVGPDTAQEILKAFSLSSAEVLSEYPIACVNAGLGHLIFGVKSYATLQKIKSSPEFPALLEKLKVPECQLFTMETLDKANDIHTRNLCLCLRPGQEDPACGNGNAALGGYFLKYAPQGRDEIYLKAEQGAVIGLPCLIHIHSRHMGGAIETFIGGQARYGMQGTISL